MNTLVVSYLRDSVDDRVALDIWVDMNKLPIFLRDTYEFCILSILGRTCVLVESKKDVFSVDTINKHMNRINQIAGLPIVFYFRSISRYRRRSLIENRISFLVENGQMYLPFLALDLKNVRESIDKNSESFSVSAQAVYLHFLYKPNQQVNQEKLAGQLKFSSMTASRALKELSKANLVTYVVGGKTGRSKKYKRISDPDFFKQGKSYLKSPVNEIVYVKEEPKGSYIAGLDALARLSMLNSPSKPVRAMSRMKFSRQNIEVITNRDIIQDTQLFEVQLWSYDPAHFSDNEYVDVLSLYASFKDDRDERVEQALDEVLKGETWYTE